MYLRNVLTRKFQWELGSVIRAMDIATIRIDPDTVTTHMDTIGLIGTTVITTDATIMVGTATTATIGIIGTTITNLM